MSERKVMREVASDYKRTWAALRALDDGAPGYKEAHDEWERALWAFQDSEVPWSQKAELLLADLDAERAAALLEAAEWCESWGPISSTEGAFNKGCAATYEHVASHLRYVAKALNGRAGSGSEAACDSEATKATETDTP